MILCKGWTGADFQIKKHHQMCVVDGWITEVYMWICVMSELTRHLSGQQSVTFTKDIY